MRAARRADQPPHRRRRRATTRRRRPTSTPRSSDAAHGPADAGAAARPDVRRAPSWARAGRGAVGRAPTAIVPALRRARLAGRRWPSTCCATAPPGRFAVAGHSMGGRVALRDAARRRRSASHGWRCSTPRTTRSPAGRGRRARARRPPARCWPSRASRACGRWRAQWALGMVHPSRLGTPVFEAVLDMFERGTPEAFAAQIEALLARPRCRRRCSRDDPRARRCCCAAATTPGARRRATPSCTSASPARGWSVLEHCGHMSTMEQPARGHRGAARPGSTAVIAARCRLSQVKALAGATARLNRALHRPARRPAMPARHSRHHAVRRRAGPQGLRAEQDVLLVQRGRQPRGLPARRGRLLRALRR